MATVRTARAWLYKEQLREILERKQINVVRAYVEHWCTCVMRSKVEPMEGGRGAGTYPPRRHCRLGTRIGRPNGFLEALNELFQAAKRGVHEASSACPPYERSSS